MKMTVFGTGYLGATHAVCMAELGHDVLGVDIDEDVIEIAKANAKLNGVRPRFVQADIFPWLRDAAARGEASAAPTSEQAMMARVLKGVHW